MPNPYDQTATDIQDLAARAGVDAAKKTIAGVSKDSVVPSSSLVNSEKQFQLPPGEAQSAAVAPEMGGNEPKPTGAPSPAYNPHGVTADPTAFRNLMYSLSPEGRAAAWDQYVPDSVPGKQIIKRGLESNPFGKALAGSVAPEKPVRGPEAPGAPGQVDPSQLQHPSPQGDVSPGGGGGGGGGGGVVPIPQEIWKLGPMAREAYLRGFQSQINAAKAEDEAMQPILDQEKEFWKQQAEKAQAHADGVAQAASDDKLKKQAALKFYVDTAKDLATQGKVDPERWWNSRSTPQKIMLTIASGLAAGGAALHGNTSENFILSNINHRIAEDIDAQKTEYAMKEKAGEAAKNAFGMAMGIIGDDRAAEATAWAASLDAAKAKLAEFDAQTKSALEKVKLRKAMAGIDMQIASYIQQATAYGVPGGIGGGAGAGLSKHDEAEMKWLAEQLEKADYAPTMQIGAQVMSAYRNGGEGVGAFANYLYTKSPFAYEKMYGPEAAQREMLWNAFRNQAIKSLSGSGVTGTEMVRMQLQLDAANDPASRMSAAKNVMNTVQSRANQAIVAVNPRVSDVFFSRLMGAPGMQQPQAAPLPPSSPVKPAK